MRPDEHLAALKSRDSAAQLRLRTQVLVKLERTCTRILKDKIRGEALAHDVFNDFIWGKVDLVKSGSAINRYLKVMATNAALMALRDPHLLSDPQDEAGPVGEGAVLSADSPEPGGIPGGWGEASREVCLDCVQQGVARLNRQERLAIQWRFKEDITVTEVGKRLGVSKQRASKVVNDALKKLKRSVTVCIREAVGEVT